MARARNIKPGFYKNEDLAECSIWARFVFPGLWMLADRDGRLEDRPKRIKAELLPFDTAEVEPLLRELAEKRDSAGVPFIVRYQNDDGRFIQISKFSEHQSPHYSEKKSVIKPPQHPEKEPNTSGGNSGSGGGMKPGAPPEPSEKAPPIKRGSQPPDSLNPDSLNPECRLSDSPNPDCGKPPSAGPQADTASVDAYPPEFEALWSAYPKRVGDNPKRKAYHAWRARLKEGVTAEAIADGVQRYASFLRAGGKEHTEFVKQAATFFGPDRPFLDSWQIRAGAGGNASAFAEAERRLFGASGERDITDEAG